MSGSQAHEVNNKSQYKYRIYKISQGRLGKELLVTPPTWRRIISHSTMARIIKDALYMRDFRTLLRTGETLSLRTYGTLSLKV
jgi:hypothetical protein